MTEILYFSYKTFPAILACQGGHSMDYASVDQHKVVVSSPLLRGLPFLRRFSLGIGVIIVLVSIITIIIVGICFGRK